MNASSNRHSQACRSYNWQQSLKNEVTTISPFANANGVSTNDEIMFLTSSLRYLTEAKACSANTLCRFSAPCCALVAPPAMQPTIHIRWILPA